MPRFYDNPGPILYRYISLYEEKINSGGTIKWDDKYSTVTTLAAMLSHTATHDSS